MNKALMSALTLYLLALDLVVVGVIMYRILSPSGVLQFVMAMSLVFFFIWSGESDVFGIIKYMESGY